MKGDYFCKWQLETKEGIACDAHLAEGHAFLCPYKKEEIYDIGMGLQIAHKDNRGNLVGRCEDFVFIENEEKSLQKL